MNKKVCSTFVVPELFTKDEVQKILQYTATLILEPATVTTTGARSAAQPKVRKSDVTWLQKTNDNQWMYERIFSAFTEANETLYDFEFDTIQDIQYIKYNPFHYFRPHFDCSTEVTSVRKLGISVQLSESNDYFGGNMTVEAAEGTITLPREAGTALIFPPYLKHQAKTVYFGKRHCLVTWVTLEGGFR